VVEPLLDNPRSLTAKVAAVLGGTAIERPQLTGFLNSEFDPFLMYGMTAATAGSAAAPQVEGEIVEVRSRKWLRAWHDVYCEAFGGDARGRQEWQRIYDALGPSGDRSLLLLLARVDGSPAATGGVYFEPDLAGLYCFTTRERMRGRGLASALVHTSHAAAQGRGIERALLQATASGRPVYIRAGYREQRTLPVLMRRGEPTG
jgi:GNAT superfamily N-acetyltransferase